MTSYFDTSALVKLLIEENGSDETELLWQQAGEVIVSRLVWPEAYSALASAWRGKRLTDGDFDAATRVLRQILEPCTTVSVADRLLENAADLVAVFDLSAADAIHLATALLAEESDVVFVTWDKRLRQAAARAGLVTAPAKP